MTAAKTSPVPASASKARDRRPRKAPAQKATSVAAREAEASDGFVTIEQCGVTLRIPVGGKVPYKSRIAFLQGDNDLGTELLLGAEQWQALMDRNPTCDEMNEIGAKIQATAGN